MSHIVNYPENDVRTDDDGPSSSDGGRFTGGVIQLLYTNWPFFIKSAYLHILRINNWSIHSEVDSILPSTSSLFQLKKLFQ